MSDDAGRRVRKTFEPPPWERDQFERLARLKVEEQERQAAEEAAWRESVLAAARAHDSAERQDDEGVIAQGPDVAGATTASASDKAKPVGVDEVKIQAMLLELSVEDRPVLREFRRAGAIAAGVLGLAGSIVLVLGIVLMIQGGTKGLVGAGMIAATGMLVVGFAVWLGYRAGRGQGS
jgi:hypothetical protein